ncbi:Protein NLP9 [Forsythia ovata]|uniref:Protein NLP9 n=1 Tax=Forsythia ovata TaxID=205694 RepID=A0ABD1UYG8_9LAMI
MQRFLHVCEEHYLLRRDKVLLRKLFNQINPYFFLMLSEHPFVHHALKFDLNAVVATRLRSTFTGDDDYILEFFLPADIKWSNEQQLLINNLSITMQMICRSLRITSNAELLGDEDSNVGFQDKKVQKLSPLTLSMMSSQ